MAYLPEPRISPSVFLKHMAIPGHCRVYLLGCLERRVTLLSQQIRALNLIYSLYELDRLKEGDRVAVIGGGAAGLTATAAAAVCGCKVTLFEQKPQFLHLQANCTKRWVHPHIYDWPAEGSLDESASEVEILVWHAATAGEVADQLLEQWAQLRGTLPTDRIDLQTSVKDLTIAAQGDITWAPGFQHGEYEAIILALGFGLERSFPPLPLRSYWRDDELDQDEILEGRRFLVSGTGDGGLTDLLRLCVRRFRHDKMVRDFGLTIDRPEPCALADQLMAIENKAIQAEHPNKCITIAYQKLKHVEWVDTLLQERLKKSVVLLNGLDQFPLSLDASVLNRFLASRLLSLHAADYWPGEISKIEHVDSHYEVELKGRHTRRFDEIVIRHGTKSALQASFPEIANACEQQLRPRNELDQTRFQIWPRGWFLDRLSQRAAKPLPPPLKKQSPEPKSAANNDLPRGWRDDTRKPSGEDTPPLAGRAPYSSLLHSILRREIPRQLRRPNVFRPGLSRVVTVELRDDPCVRARVDRFEWLESVNESRLLSTDRIGNPDRNVLARQLCSERSLHVAMSPALLASAAIFTYLRDEPAYRLNLRLNYHFTHARDLVDCILQGRVSAPETAVMALAPAIRLLTQSPKSTYQLSMLLPQQSYRVLVNKSKNNGPYKPSGYALPAGRYLLPIEGTPGALFQFERLVLGGRIDPRRTSIEHVNPDEAIAVLRDVEKDTLTILWSPYWQIIDSLGVGVVLDGPAGHHGWEHVALIVRSSFMQRHPGRVNALSMAVRAAWLDLLEDPNKVERAVEYMMKDGDFFKALRRTLGLYNLEFHA